jgi:hypothetical protein
MATCSSVTRRRSGTHRNQYADAARTTSIATRAAMIEAPLNRAHSMP